MDVKKVYLNGTWVGSDETTPVVSPATGETIAQVATVDRAQVRQAIADAHASLEAWRKLPAKGRGDYLLAIGAELARRKDEIARLITQENGKPLAQSRGEVDMSVDH